MKEDFINLPRAWVSFFRYSAMAGFLAITALIINLNHKAFNKLFGEKAKTYRWVFLVTSIFPLLLFLYIFALLFGKADLREQGELVLRIFGRKGLEEGQ